MMMRAFAACVLAVLSFPVSSFSLSTPTRVHPDWLEFKPAEGLTCARGAPYSAFISPGDPSRVIIDFMGGGACWNGQNCAKETETFVDRVDYLRERAEKGLKGFYERTNPSNPLKEWTHVIVPYCTGDIHMGDAVVDYTDIDGESFSINHQGAKNASAVLKWVKNKFPSPQRVFVTGCSAGAYGSIYWTPRVKKNFPNSHVVQFADSGAGVKTDSFFRDSFKRWNPTTHAPSWIDGLDPLQVDWTTLSLHDLYTEVANYYPDLSLGQFNQLQDEVQIFFYTMMGGDPFEWTEKMLRQVDALNSEISRFNAYTMAGDRHCVLTDELFYEAEQNGVPFHTWFGRVARGEEVEDVQAVRDPSAMPWNDV